MVEENNNLFKKKADVESELYALINTILNVYEKFEEGVVQENFLRRTLNNTIEELLKFNFYLDKKKINLTSLLEKMNFSEQYYKAIELINKLSSLDFPSSDVGEELTDQSLFTKKMSQTVLNLPSITLEITTSFITLMDALKLKGFEDSEIIDKLFTDLKNDLKKFPGIDDLLFRVKAINKRAFNSEIDRSNRTSEIIADELYKIFREFQDKLNLNP
ncbi:MAG: hypothetical protein ACFFEN_05790 [Candidatus Thorarchaeota archaeon]